MASEKPVQEEPTQPVIVEEKITKKNGEVVTKKYLKGKMLGKGGFATAFEMTDLEKNKLYAGKVVAKGSLTKKRALEKLLAEIKIHKSLNHEYIVQFEHVFEDRENVYILLEICPNQTLKELLKKQKRLTEPECATYIAQTIHALKYLHSRKIIHRDLKLGNLLIGRQLEIKVADFGLAAKIEQDGERRKTICGTPNYIAPEVLDKKLGHSYEVDVWSLGVICYTLLFGRPPFETNDTKATYRKILKLSYAFPPNTTVSENAKDLIKRILVLEPSKRPTLDEILEHPFIRNNYKPNQLRSEGSRKNLTIQSTTSSHPFGASADKAFLQSAMTPSQVNLRDVSPDKDIDENEIYGQSTLKKSGKFAMGQNKIKSYEVRHDDLVSGLSPRTFMGNNDRMNLNLKPDYETYVAKWVDYSSKYGLGYLLSDGTAGILFKDMSRVTLSPDGLKMEYMKRRPEHNKEILITFSMSDYPSELQKKVTLLNYFKNYLEGNTKATNEQEEEKDKENQGEKDKEKINGRESVKPMPLVYVKKWMKTKYAVLFRMSNRIVQIEFNDKTQIILSRAYQIVCYKNKTGEQTQYPLANALESENPEMVKRLKYAKEILDYFKAGPKKKTEAATTSTLGINIGAALAGVDMKIDSVPTPEL